MVRALMDPHYTKIALLLDASGSMYACREAVIEGFNAFLWEQQVAAAGRASLTVALFNGGLNAVVRDVPLDQVSRLAGHQYIPHGGSSLLSGLGGLVQGVGYRMGTLPEAERPARVVVAILTDGRVNNSGNYSPERVQHLVRHQQEKYSWEFRFCGAQNDSLVTAESLGIEPAHTFDFTLDPAGVKQSFATLSREVLAVRRLGSMGDA